MHQKDKNSNCVHLCRAERGRRASGLPHKNITCMHRRADSSLRNSKFGLSACLTRATAPGTCAESGSTTSLHREWGSTRSAHAPASLHARILHMHLKLMQLACLPLAPTPLELKTAGRTCVGLGGPARQLSFGREWEGARSATCTCACAQAMRKQCAPQTRSASLSVASVTERT
jgi:hypothetical protein